MTGVAVVLAAVAITHVLIGLAYAYWAWRYPNALNRRTMGNAIALARFPTSLSLRMLSPWVRLGNQLTREERWQ